MVMVFPVSRFGACVRLDRSRDLTRLVAEPGLIFAATPEKRCGKPVQRLRQTVAKPAAIT
jgi:hypothetical protein